MTLYSTIVSTVNKVFTKEHGRHWFINNTFDEIFLNGHFGDGKQYVNHNYRRNCMIKALRKIEELDGVKTITKEEAKKYIPAVVAEVEAFRNKMVEEYFGTWEKLEEHYNKVEAEREKAMEKISFSETCISLVDEVKPLEQNVKTFNFDFTQMIKAAMAENNA